MLPKLSHLVDKVIGDYLDKSIDHRCWEAPVLSERQLEYAAADAWAHLRLWQVAPHMTKEDLVSPPSPPTPFDTVTEDGSGEAEVGGDGEGEEGNVEDGSSSDGEGSVEGDAVAGAATYRHQQRRARPGHRASRRRTRQRSRVQLVGGSSSGGAHDPAVMAQVDAAAGTAADEADEADDGMAEDDGEERSEEHAAAAATTLQASRDAIDAYAASNRSSDLELPCSLSAAERKELHGHADTHKLVARSVGVGRDTQLIISRWKPLTAFTAAIGASAVGATVARDAPHPAPAPARASRSRSRAAAAYADAEMRAAGVGAPESDPLAAAVGGGRIPSAADVAAGREQQQRDVQQRRGNLFEAQADAPAAVPLMRGSVIAFDANEMRWQLKYTNDTEEWVGVDLLNMRLQRRHTADAIGDDVAPSIGADPAEIEGFISGIVRDWAKGRIKYDIRHFMANFSSMVAADKSSPAYGIFMAYVSASIFKILPGEHDRVRRHMEGLGMTSAAIGKAPRRYWRRMGRYSCPEPEVIIRGLYDVFSFFRNMKDPARPEHNFFVRDAWAIFTKEIAYVQKGYLSDVPGMNMYRYHHTCARTGFIFYRGVRSSSALEGYHMHLRAAQHPGAKHSGYKLETARSNLFDFAWNIRAAESAGNMRHHGHFSIWHVDTLARLCDGWLTPGTDAEPPALRGFRRTRTDVAPLTTRGIDWEQVKLLSAVGARALGLAALQSREEQQAVLQYPALVGAGDAAGIERATGIRTSSARLLALASQVCLQAAADAALNAAGVMTLQEGLHRTAGDAPPRELQLSAAPQPASTGVAGPLPFDVGQGRTGCGAAIIEPASFDNTDDDDGMAADGGDGGGEDGGEDGGGDGGEQGGEQGSGDGEGGRTDHGGFYGGPLTEEEYYAMPEKPNGVAPRGANRNAYRKKWGQRSNAAFTDGENRKRKEKHGEAAAHRAAQALSGIATGAEADGTQRRCTRPRGQQ